MSTCQRELQDARDDADRYRDEAERLRQQQQRERDERERQRKEDRKRNDPSNRLYSGDVTDFNEAIQLHVVCLQREIVPIDPTDEFSDLDVKCNETMREGIAAAHKAALIYREIVTDAQAKAVAAMRAAGLNEWANCLESGDYSSMAV